MPTPDGSGGRRTALLVAAIVGVLALVGASVAFVGGDDEPESATTSTTSDDGEAPPEPTQPDGPDEAPVSEDEFRALIDELEDHVEEARGLEFQDEVVVDLADGAEFERRLLEDFEDDVEEIEEDEIFYRALGLLDSEVTLLEELRAIYSAGVLGFYDPETNELVVRGRTPSPYVQQTIVHELVHALDDQHFELHREQYDDREDEISAGFGAVVEGNARRVENEWMQDQPADFQAEASEEEAAFAEGIDPSAFPQILLFEIGAPYQFGETFVSHLLAQGGERAVDAALTDPPETSEQFVFPQVYDQRQPRVEVPPPPADGEVVDGGVVGVTFLIGLLSTGETAIDQSAMVAAVNGWGGDWAVTWIDDDQACLRADFVGDTEADTGEIEQALSAWVENSGTGEVSMVDGRVRLESCNASAGGPPPQV